jgi:hypothetical protein
MKYDPARHIVPARPVKADEKPRNLTAREGAVQLAAELDDWWHSRGFLHVHHWIESKRIPTQGTHNMTWCVRSNLVGGMPPAIPGAPTKWAGPIKREISR